MTSTGKREMRIMRTIFCLVVITLTCSIPAPIAHINHSHIEHPNYFLFVHILYWLPYCLNTVVYILMNKQYREAYFGTLAKVIPSWKKYKRFRFFWETRKQSSSQCCQVAKCSVKKKSDCVSNSSSNLTETNPGVEQCTHSIETTV